MKYVNGKIIIEQILDSFEEYDQIPGHGKEFICRLLDDLKYNRTIRKDSLDHFEKYFEHLFESTVPATKEMKE